MKLHIVLIVFCIACIPALLNAEVLGPCGTGDAQKPAIAAPAAAAQMTQAASCQRLLLPGEQAPNFELAAIVKDEVKQIKLSDFDGKWRVVCFYPADFTFV
jgi:hypothetical protein